MLTEAEKQKIAQAVSEAESKTRGEIVTAIIPESDDYAFWELLFALITGIVCFVIISLQAEAIESLMNRILWFPNLATVLFTAGGISLIAGGISYFILQIPLLDRLIVGKKRMSLAVRKRALRHFVESQAYDTQDRSGVLLFISVLERRVELIADKGINENVAAEKWEEIVSTLIQGIKMNDTANSIEKAVKKIGELLAEYMPPVEDDKNELPDTTLELGKGS